MPILKCGDPCNCADKNKKYERKYRKKNVFIGLLFITENKIEFFLEKISYFNKSRFMKWITQNCTVCSLRDDDRQLYSYGNKQYS